MQCVDATSYSSDLQQLDDEFICSVDTGIQDMDLFFDVQEEQADDCAYNHALFDESLFLC